MPIEGIPEDAKQSVLNIGGRAIRVSLAPIGSHEVKGDAFLSYAVDPAVAKHSEAVRSIKVDIQHGINWGLVQHP